MKLGKNVLKIMEMVEKSGFTIREMREHDGEFYVEFGQHTPLGEDWWETIYCDGIDESFIQAIEERCNEFDIDEEAELWITHRGTNGVPNSIQALLADAEWKQSKLYELKEHLIGISMSFLNDSEKMIDFFTVSKKDFLDFYNYLTKEEYESTKREILQRSGYWNADDVDEDIDGRTIGKIVCSIMMTEWLEVQAENRKVVEF